MTMRIRISHPFPIDGVVREAGTVIEVDDRIAKRAISAGVATLSTATAVKEQTLDPALELALAQRLGRARDEARLSRPDTRLGPVTTEATVTVNTTAQTATFTRAYSVQGTGGYGKIRDVADVGEGLDFDYLTTWQTAFGPFNIMPRSIRFMTDADRVLLMLNANAPAGVVNHSFVVYVDGSPVSLTPHVPSAGGLTVYHQITFPGGGGRVRYVEFRTSSYLGTIAVPKPYDIWKPPPRKGPRTLIIGDSWTSTATCSVAHMNACYWNIGPRIGSEDVWIDQFGGTGYSVTNAGDGAGTTNRYIDRVTGNIDLLGQTWNIEAINPGLVVVHGGGANDIFKGKTDNQIINAVETVFTRLRERLPRAKLVYVEGFAPPGFTPATYNPRYIAIRQGAQARLAGAGVYYLDVATTSPWVKGAGTVAVPNADAENANVYVVADTFHQTDAGHLMVRGRISQLLRRVILDDGSKADTLLSAGAAA